MKKHLFSISLIIIFVGALTFKYLTHGIPAVFFSDLGGIYPDLTDTKNLFLSFASGWRDLSSQPFYWIHAQSNYWTPLALFFVEDIWLKIKLTQILQILLAAILSYKFSFHLFKDRKIALVSGLIYASTPFFFSMLNGHNSLTWSYVVLPATFFLIEKMFLLKKYYLALLAGIFISLTTFISGIQFIFYTGLPIFIYLAVRYAVIVLQEKKNLLFNNYLKLLTVATVAVFSFSAFFLLPSFFGHQPYTQLESEVSYRKNDFVTNFYTPNLKENLSLQSKEHLVAAEFGYDLDQLPSRFVYFYIDISVIALLSVFFALERKGILYNQSNYWAFLIASAFAFILSFGKHTFIFKFLSDLLPYFWTIRTPGRFLIVYVLFVSILAPFVIYKILLMVLSRFQNQRIISGIKIAFVLSGMCLIFYVAFFFSRSLLTFKTVDNMDEHYVDLSAVNKKLLELNVNNDYRVIDLVIEKDGNPHHLKAYSAGQRAFLNSYDILWRFKDDPNLARILGMLNIKYIMTAPWPAWPEILDAPFPPLENNLEHNSDFRLAYSSPEGIKIWENQYALPKAYEATPIFVIGPVSSISSVFDLFPDTDSLALFFADQISDKKDIASIISRSKLIFMDSRYDEKPSYLSDFNWGLAYNSDFYLNPQNYSNNDKNISKLAYESNKPIVEVKKQEKPAITDLLSGIATDQNGVRVEVTNNRANIASEGKFGHRFEPKEFDNPSEIIYKITTKMKGRLKININAISLFDENYIKASISKDNQNYENILKLNGSSMYPDFYEGSLWVNDLDSSPIFLKIEGLTNKRTSREIYDSRVEKLELAFIPELEYNYTNVTGEGLSDIFDKHGKLELISHHPGKSNYKVTGDIKNTAIVETEIYTPEWLLKNKKNYSKSLPTNIFNNGFLVGETGQDFPVIIKYSIGLARGIGAAITVITVILLAISFKKRI